MRLFIFSLFFFLFLISCENNEKSAKNLQTTNEKKSTKDLQTTIEEKIKNG